MTYNLPARLIAAIVGPPIVLIALAIIAAAVAICFAAVFVLAATLPIWVFIPGVRLEVKGRQL